ncbi:hypothetical protein [Streptomyces sp. RKAG337]|nr:hypothetical protein [Streptomyces sp. RKAG337]MCM2425199.1 hypothetical protein [Streptomyces sp. RKAG337]
MITRAAYRYRPGFGQVAKQAITEASSMLSYCSGSWLDDHQLWSGG